MTEREIDQQLVARAQGGDQKAFDVLVQKYQRKLSRLLSRYIRDAAEVEDVAQEAFIKAYRALPAFRGDSAFYTWLYRIAVNTAKKFLLESKHDPLLAQAAPASDEEDETSWKKNEPSTDEGPESLLAAKEIAQVVNAAMDALPQELRQAVVLREIEGMSYDDIALAMDCPVGTVRSRIFRAREAISQKVKPLLSRQGGKRW